MNLPQNNPAKTIESIVLDESSVTIVLLHANSKSPSLFFMSRQDNMPEKEQTSASEEEKKGEADSPDKKNGTEKTEEDEEKEGEEGKEKEVIIDPKDWPMVGIKEHCDNDVLFGRGGKIFHNMLLLFSEFSLRQGRRFTQRFAFAFLWLSNIRGDKSR